MKPWKPLSNSPEATNAHFLAVPLTVAARTYMITSVIIKSSTIFDNHLPSSAAGSRESYIGNEIAYISAAAWPY